MASIPTLTQALSYFKELLLVESFHDSESRLITERDNLIVQANSVTGSGVPYGSIYVPKVYGTELVVHMYAEKVNVNKLTISSLKRPPELIEAFATNRSNINVLTKRKANLNRLISRITARSINMQEWMHFVNEFINKPSEDILGEEPYFISANQFIFRFINRHVVNEKDRDTFIHKYEDFFFPPCHTLTDEKIESFESENLTAIQDFKKHLLITSLSR